MLRLVCTRYLTYVLLCCFREYYDDPAHANELQGVDKDKYVAGGWSFEVQVVVVVFYCCRCGMCAFVWMLEWNVAGFL
jgi:hypothetical protein